MAKEWEFLLWNIYHLRAEMAFLSTFGHCDFLKTNTNMRLGFFHKY